LKNSRILIIEARLEALALDDKTEDKEYKECLFINGALKKGWLVSDIEMPEMKLFRY